jgi:biopolymer transport protein ExbD
MMLKFRTSPGIFTDSNTLQFASVMAVVVFIVLLVFMTLTPYHHGYSPDLPKVWHPVSMPGALREDAMHVTVTRDGRVYFGTDHVATDELAEQITERLTDRGIERKVYVVVDTRVSWGTVKPVLAAVHSAGIIRVAFLVDQRRVPSFPR